MTVRHCPDILRWLPPTWDLFLGNYRLKTVLRRLLTATRRQIELGDTAVSNRPCLLVLGPSRTGKTALVKFFCRCLVCESLDPVTLNPCDGSCWACKQKPELYGHSGIFLSLREASLGRKASLPVHFVPIDCTRIYTPAELREILDDLRDGIAYNGIRVIYLDEVHRLVHRSMDEILLKAVEEQPYLWLLSSAKPGPLEDMLKNRLLKIGTQLPSEEEMESWLCDRCDEWGINWEPEAVVRIVEKSNRIVGTALHALALAAIAPNEGLTLDLVETEWTVQVED